jgi:hypothetical protein
VVALLASVVQFLISRWDHRTETAETRLQDLEKSYAEVAQPAMAQVRVCVTTEQWRIEVHPAGARCAQYTLASG